jgi:hypothetical protein
MGADFSALLARLAPPPPPSTPPVRLPSDPTGSQKYGQAQGDYATYSSQEIAKTIRDTNQALKPLRAKTAPADDLALERRKISIDARASLVLIQVALFLVFLSLLSYMVLPRDWAHGISFLLLCVGIGSGFFLRR